MKLQFLFLLAIIFIISCKNKTSDKSIQDTTGPLIAFNKDTLDFGTVKKGDTVKMGFQFTNAGKENLKIVNVVAGCSCSVASYPPNEIPPGKSDNIFIKFNSASIPHKEFVSKTFVVQVNAKPSVKILTIQGTVN